MEYKRMARQKNRATLITTDETPSLPAVEPIDEDKEKFSSLIISTKSLFAEPSEQLLTNLTNLFEFWPESSTIALINCPILQVFFYFYKEQKINIDFLLDTFDVISDNPKIIHQFLNQEIIDFLIDTLSQASIQHAEYIISIFSNIANAGSYEASKLGEKAVSCSVELLKSLFQNDFSIVCNLFGLIVCFFEDLLDKEDFFPLLNFNEIILLLFRSIQIENIDILNASLDAIEAASRCHRNELMNVINESDLKLLCFVASKSEETAETVLEVFINITNDSPQKFRENMVDCIEFSNFIFGALQTFPSCFSSVLRLTNNLIQLNYENQENIKNHSSMMLRKLFNDVLRIFEFLIENISNFSTREKIDALQLFCSVIELSDYQMKTLIIEKDEIILFFCELFLMKPEINFKLLCAFNKIFEVPDINERLTHVYEIIIENVNCDELAEECNSSEDMDLIYEFEKFDEKMNSFQPTTDDTWQ